MRQAFSHRIPVPETLSDREARRLGFGGLPLQRIPVSAAEETVDFAYQAGIRFFDTSRAYGESEAILGRVLQGRNDAIICTKSRGRDWATICHDIETSMENLKRKHIDIFMLHNVNKEDYSNCFNQLYKVYTHFKRNQIKKVGMSSHQFEVVNRFADSSICGAVEFPFNFIEKELPSTRAFRWGYRGIEFIAMKPVCGGVLNCPDSSLRWILSKEDRIKVIPGMRSPEEVASNIAAIRQPFTEDDLVKLQAESVRLGDSFCRRCEYCLPCPQGINPSMQIQWRYLMEHRDGWETLTQDKVDLIKLGRKCTGCGSCQGRCPYNLPLIKLVKQETELLLKEAKERGINVD
jgi:predicted aldo/keto reductase-like oxidoreductase